MSPPEIWSSLLGRFFSPISLKDSPFTTGSSVNTINSVLLTDCGGYVERLVWKCNNPQVSESSYTLPRNSTSMWIGSSSFLHMSLGHLMMGFIMDVYILCICCGQSPPISSFAILEYSTNRDCPCFYFHMWCVKDNLELWCNFKFFDGLVLFIFHAL